MRWQLASTFAVTAMSAGCDAPDTHDCGSEGAPGILCPEGLECTGNTTGNLCGPKEEVAQCKDATVSATGARQLCVRSADAGGGQGICVDKLCGPCAPELFECRYSEWTQVKSPSSGFLSVWVESLNEAYAVGNDGAVARYDGVNWQLEMLEGGLALVGVWSTGDDVYALSNEGTAYRNGQPMPNANTPPLIVTKLWGKSADDLVAVGAEGGYGEFKGTQWNWQTFGGLLTINDVFGVGDSVIVVGRDKVRHRPSRDAAWEIIAAPNTGDELLGVWGLSANDFYVVGNPGGNSGVGVIHHFRDGAWSTPSLPTDMRIPRLVAIWGSGSDDIHVVADDGAVLHFDGEKWAHARMVSTGPDFTDVSGHTGDSTKDAIAVAGDGTIWRISP